jgi:short subunit dehydrogenase-like uncharacterized protein
VAAERSGGRIVLYGATGYTGRLVLDALAGTDVPLVVAGRSEERLRPLAEQHDADMVVADAAAPDGSMRAALQAGDVLVSTVGPFVHLGEPVVEVAVRTGAHYVDSTGEGPFIRQVFDRWGPQAQGRSVLLPAFGYDFVPGNLAAGLALRDAGPEATAVDVGYFTTGTSGGGVPLSSGTTATSAFMLLQPRYAYRDGRLTDAGGVRRQRGFPLDGATAQALEIPGSEQFDVPATFPHVREVTTYLGWFGAATTALRVASVGATAWSRLPLLGRIPPLVGRQLMRRTGAGPDAQQRARSRTAVIAEARDADGLPLASVTLDGPNAYTLTGALLAWAATRLASDPPDRTGAHGPLGAFGLDDLEAGAASLGLHRIA